jgi:hypothetical protein
MRGEELQVGRSPAARTVCVASSSIYWVMSALVAGPPQTYREVLAFLSRTHLINREGED